MLISDWGLQKLSRCAFQSIRLNNTKKANRYFKHLLVLEFGGQGAELLVGLGGRGEFLCLSQLKDFVN